MALNTVTVTWNLTDLLQVTLPTSVKVSFQPSVPLADSTDDLTIVNYVRSVATVGGRGSLAGIVANDNVNLIPAGSSYWVTVIDSATGKTILDPFSVLINSANGATQDLADLYATRAVTPQPLAQYFQAAQVIPFTQSFPLSNNTYRDIYTFSVTGQTDDPLPPFGQVSGSQTYSHAGGAAIRGPAVWAGYNPRKLSGQGGLTAPEIAHASLGMAWFADAGDSNNNAGGHGLEFTIGAFFQPNGGGGTNSIEIVAMDDNSNTVSTSFRCGSGSYTGPDAVTVYSGFSFTDAIGNAYLSMGPKTGAGLTPGIVMSQPITVGNMTYWNATSPSAMAAQFTSVGALTFIPRSTTSTATFTLTSDTGQSTLAINGNQTGSSSTLLFNKNGSVKWNFTESGGTAFYIINNSGNGQVLFTSGTNTAGNYDNATTYLLSEVQVYGSFSVNNGGSALATSATKGFLYLPTCAGTPTGVPVTKAGSVAQVYDTTNNKLYVYNGAWKATAALT